MKPKKVDRYFFLQVFLFLIICMSLVFLGICLFAFEENRFGNVLLILIDLTILHRTILKLSEYLSV